MKAAFKKLIWLILLIIMLFIAWGSYRQYEKSKITEAVSDLRQLYFWVEEYRDQHKANGFANIKNYSFADMAKAIGVEDSDITLRQLVKARESGNLRFIDAAEGNAVLAVWRIRGKELTLRNSGFVEIR